VTFSPSRLPSFLSCILLAFFSHFSHFPLGLGDIGTCLSSHYYNNYTNITAKADCMWFTSSTTIPGGEPTICDPALLTTSTSIANPCSADHA